MEKLSKIGKSGKGNGVLIGVIIVGVLIVSFLAWSQMSQRVDVVSLVSDVTNPNLCGDSTGVLTVNARSALEGGSDPSSPTITAGINGGVVTTSVTSGTTSFAIGSELEILVSKSDFIDKSFTTVMPCGGLELDAPMFSSSSSNPSVEIQDKNSNTLSNDVTGDTTNITNIAEGGSMKAKIIFTGVSSEATGDLIYVIEFPAGSNANITSLGGVTLGNLDEVTVPRVYVTQNAGSKVIAFAVPQIEGSSDAEYSLNVALDTGKDLSGGVYTDWFGGQEFIDTDKTIQDGVENSAGTAKYENTGGYDFYINAA